jgi:signal transduction histidine kinase
VGQPPENDVEESSGDPSSDRALTDASLDAERAGADAVTDRALAHSRRRLDYLIERDRFLADDHLLKFREKADRLVELDRMASPFASQGVEFERKTSDENIRAEREASNALLERERGRVDARSEERRRALDQDRAKQEMHRKDTNARLSDERSGADLTVAALGRITTAFADAQVDSGRRGDVLAMVTHDLRSPLTAIIAHATLLIEDTAEPATREAGEDMLGAATRMARLLEDLLDAVRIESGTLRVVKGPHDVGELLSEVLHSYRPRPAPAPAARPGGGARPR